MKAIVVLIMVALGSGPAWAAQLTPLNGVAVIVNNEVITLRDVNRRLEGEIQFLARRYAPQSAAFNRELLKLQRETIEDLVERRLVLDEFKTAGYNLPESWIENKINEDIRRDFGDRLTLTKTLQGDGITYESYRERVRERIIIDAMTRQNISEELLISPYKIEQYYEEHRDAFQLEDQIKLRMIVFPETGIDPAVSAKELAAEVLAKIKDGVPFEEMARVYSQGSQAIEGGDWGWIERSVLRTELAEAAFALRPGEMSGVIETSESCYLMRVEDTRLAHVRPLSEVRNAIETDLKNAEIERLKDKWIKKLRDKSFIRYF